MSKKSVFQFMRQTKLDKALRQQVRQLLGTGDGDISDAVELDNNEIVKLKGEAALSITQLAQTKAFNFSPQELITVIQAFERNKLGQITELELFDYLQLADVETESLEAQIIEITYRGQVYQKVIKQAPTSRVMINHRAEVVQFMSKSAQDPKLQQQLKTIIGLGDGNISSSIDLDAAEAASLKSISGYQVSQLARHYHFEFSKQDLIDVVEIFQRRRKGKISDQEFFKELGVPPDALAFLSTQKVVRLVFKGNAYKKLMGESRDKLQQINPKIAVMQFMEKSDQNEILQQELETIIGVGDGNISRATELDPSEAEALKGERGAQLTQFANRQGFTFSQQDLVDVINAFEGLRLGTLSQADFHKNVGLPTEDNITLAPQEIQKYIYRGQTYHKIDGILISFDELEESTVKHSPKMQVIEFMEATAKDTTLKQKLKQLLGVGDGDISSVAQLDSQEIKVIKEDKSNEVQAIAVQNGFNFSVVDLVEVIAVFERHQIGEISEAQLFNSLGLSKQKTGFLDQVMDILSSKLSK
ncbi:MAG: hypothetical protein AB4041_01165 [Microcystaceae cyanobacterium]